jgi:L-aspartate oxidase
VLILGSGLAGMRLALLLGEHCEVAVLTKRSRAHGNSRYAQGGIAAAWDEDDSWQAHEQDTLIAGAGLCRREVVARTVSEARQRVQELIDMGVEFDRRSETGEFDLHQEGGHTARRILHSKDLTGAEIMRALHAEADKIPDLQILEDRMAIDLITQGALARRNGEIPPAEDRVLGAYVLDATTGRVETWAARVVALCTGGAGKVYIYTSNSEVASGDGVAMAYRAGARIANMEFVQFHPTCLFHPQAGNFLISEALRGEGGRLRLASGELFMHRYDEREELAPRDIVARAIDSELKRTGDDSVFLDMSHLKKATLRHKFPNIHRRCEELGIHMETDGIPVVPAAHYLCGGVLTDLSGASSIRGLFAVGETACTGLHGANRLASNSLLEAISFACHAAEKIRTQLGEHPLVSDLPDWDSGPATEPDEQVVITQVWDEIRRFMWNYVGIVRTTRRLMRARKRVQLVIEEIDNYYWDFEVTGDLIELRNIATVAQVVVECALWRRESRGLHYTLDFPKSDPRYLRDTIIQRPWD